MSVTVLKPKKDVAPRTEKALAETNAHPLLSLRSEIDRLFDNVFSGLALRPFGPWDLDFGPLKGFEDRFHATWPKVDMAETDKAFAITAELPGMEEKDVEVTISDGCLTIQGEKRSERNEDEENYHLTERNYGKVRRTFRVPDGVAADKIEANFENGVLRITIPKTEKPAPKTVPITGHKAKAAKKAK